MPVLEWITAVGTLAAAMVPLVLFLFERRDRVRAETARDLAEAQRNAALDEFRTRELELAQERDREARELAARDQASKVHVWYAYVDGEILFYFLNRSEMPATMVTLNVWAMFKQPGKEELVEQHVLLGLVYLPPTEEAVRYRYGDLMLFSTFDDPPPDWEFQPAIAITSFSLIDSEGVEWLREIRGWAAGPLSRFEGWPPRPTT